MNPERDEVRLDLVEERFEQLALIRVHLFGNILHFTNYTETAGVHF